MNRDNFALYEVLASVTTNSTILLDVMPLHLVETVVLLVLAACSLRGGDRRFGRICRMNIQGSSVMLREAGRKAVM
jgi:hypothetical protein